MILLVLLGYLHDRCLHLQVHFHDFEEDFDRDFLLESWTNNLKEPFELLLLVLRALSRDEIHANVCLGVVQQSQVVH